MNDSFCLQEDILTSQGIQFTKEQGQQSKLPNGFSMQRFAYFQGGRADKQISTRPEGHELIN